MKNAWNDVWDGKDNTNVDDKTLRRWLLAEFHLEKSPANADEWKSIALQHFGSFFAFVFDHHKETKVPDTMS